jgi:hypothetical protein
LNGLEARNIREMQNRLKHVDEVIAGKALDTRILTSHARGFSAERLYTNVKVDDMVAKYEIEQNARGWVHPINGKLAPERRYDFTFYKFHWHSPHRTPTRWTLRMSIMSWATFCIGILSSIALFFFYWNLRLRVAPFNGRKTR